MDGKEKKGFWGGLIRSGSLALRGKGRGGNPNTLQRRRASDGESSAVLRSRRRSRHLGPDGELDLAVEPEAEPEPEPEPDDVPHPVKETNSSRPKGKGKGRAEEVEEPEVRDWSSPSSPLIDWPPSGMTSQEELSPQHAVRLISRGAPRFHGHKRPVPHASESYYALYATTTGARAEDGTDAADLRESMTTLMTLRIQGRGQAAKPWETLEQPSYAFYWGRLRGTVTLNQWASASAVLPPAIALRDSGVEPRGMSLAKVLQRLQEVQAGLEDDDVDLLYRILYKRILRDPDRLLSPHRTLDRQITDLILVLSRPGWIDFTSPRNQVVTRFIFDKGGSDDEDEEAMEMYHKFFHQLLLSVELEMRIHSRQHSEYAKEKLTRQIPPTIQWDLAVARRWREYVRVDKFGDTPRQTQLRYKLKKRQVKQLKRFAQLMKWPNLGETLENLRQKDEDFLLDSISSDAFAYFSGLILPGPTFPFLIMNTLIDLDPDPATDALALLSHTHPACGFQYRNSYTYWSASCIVGKVLAPTCRVHAGWVGPGRPTADLGRSQIARVRARRPRQVQTLAAADVRSMAERSDALGPRAEVYPVGEYALAGAERREVVDAVRIELLGLKPVGEADAGPGAFDATVQFAIDGVSWPLRLMYDVSFVAAWPCSDGPHVLFFDYVYTAIQADEIVRVQDWGGLYKQKQSITGTGRQHGHSDDEDEGHDDEEVLVVEAFGVRDNEVLARAWCSHWGLSAVVADIRKTCMACAIREAYAATITVVILIDEQQNADTDDA